MIHNSVTLDNPPAIATAFRPFFEETSSGDALDIDRVFDIYSENRLDTFDYLWSDFVNDITMESISLAINKLSANKDAGPMAIPATVIKDSSSLILPRLHQLFNSIIVNGYFPTAWKKSFLIPIPKKGDFKIISNYRGIALQSCLPKLFDQILTEKLYNIVEPIISKYQHGFVKKRSTQTNLINLVDFLSAHLANGKSVDVLYLDIAKAFDRLDHSIIITLLSKLAFPYNIISLISSMLTNREYVLKLNDVPNDRSILPTAGVPQGSHIGPLLFLLCINDLPLNLTNCLALMYADDTKIYRVIDTTSDILSLQHDLDSTINWLAGMKLNVNASKCYHVTYSLKNQPLTSSYLINDIRVPSSTSVKDLGVYFDSKLKFSTHLNHTLASCSTTGLYSPAQTRTQNIQSCWYLICRLTPTNNRVLLDGM